MKETTMRVKITNQKHEGYGQTVHVLQHFDGSISVLLNGKRTLLYHNEYEIMKSVYRNNPMK